MSSMKNSKHTAHKEVWVVEAAAAVGMKVSAEQ